MGTSRRQALLGVLAASLVQAQEIRPEIIRGDDDTPKRLPNGKLQSDAILKADYNQNVKDARELTALAKSIELDFDKNDQNVLSLGLLKKLEDIEKISKRMQARIRH